MATYRHSRIRYRPYRYRGRYGRGGVPREAVAAGVILAAVVSAGAHQVTAHAAPAASIPSESSYTPQTWAAAILAAAGEPATPCNKSFFVAWTAAEGGAWQNNAAGNPLNDTLPEPGSRVVVPFRKRALVGVVLECSSRIPGADKLREIVELVDPLPALPPGPPPSKTQRPTEQTKPPQQSERPLHVCPESQLCPHHPQLAASVLTLVQAP